MLKFLMGALFLMLVSPLSGTAQEAHSGQIAATPPMGWNSWNHFGEKVSDSDVRAAADALVTTGMRDAGYVYVNIDDTWQGERDASGRIHSNKKFPDMKALGEYIHARGLKFGIYSSPGPKTCAGYEGSLNHEQQDADTYADWGVDFLKYDLCSFEHVMNAKGGNERSKAALARQAYETMGHALARTKRPIVYSFCQYGRDSVWEWAPSLGANLWRTTPDIRDSYRSMALIGFSQAGLEKYAGPGHWNDPDMLEIGNGGMTADQYRTQMSLWSMLAAPLLAGNDLSHMDEGTREILTNREVIAVDQDRLGVQGRRVKPPQIWAKPLRGGDIAVALFNYVLDDAANPITFKLTEIGITGPVHARNLWSHKDMGVITDSFTAIVPAGGVVMLRLTK